MKPRPQYNKIKKKKKVTYQLRKEIPKVFIFLWNGRSRTPKYKRRNINKTKNKNRISFKNRKRHKNGERYERHKLVVRESLHRYK